MRRFSSKIIAQAYGNVVETAFYRRTLHHVGDAGGAADFRGPVTVVHAGAEFPAYVHAVEGAVAAVGVLAGAFITDFQPGTSYEATSSCGPVNALTLTFSKSNR